MVWDFQTGDILVWIGTTWGDLALRSLFGMQGSHSSMIFRGEKYSKYSQNGISPSATYTTFNVDQLYPIEEIISKIWFRGNGSQLVWVRRRAGPKICFRKGSQAYESWLNLERHPISEIVRVCVYGYLEGGARLPNNGEKNRRYQYCSAFIGYMLKQFRLLKTCAEPNNLFPENFYHCRFHARYQYTKITIFDKQNNNINWIITGALMQKGIVKQVQLRNKNVDELLRDYQFVPSRNSNKNRDQKVPKMLF